MENTLTPKLKKRRTIKFATPSYKSPLLNKVVKKTEFDPSKASLEELKPPTLELWQKNEAVKKDIEDLKDEFATPSYKSPLLNKVVKKTEFDPSKASLEELKPRTLELWEKNEAVKKQIEVLKDEGYEESQLQWHIDKLHEYNEIKDIAQMVMGRLAVYEQTTVRKIHEEFAVYEQTTVRKIHEEFGMTDSD